MIHAAIQSLARVATRSAGTECSTMTGKPALVFAHGDFNIHVQPFWGIHIVAFHIRLYIIIYIYIYIYIYIHILYIYTYTHIYCICNQVRIPFGDHPLNLERSRTD